MAQQRKRLGQILEEMGIITRKQLQQALTFQQQNSGKKLGEILINLGMATSSQVTEALAIQFDLPFVELDSMEIPPEIIASVPKAVCEEYMILPVKRSSRLLTIAMTDPLDLFTLDNLRFILNTDVECVLAPRESVEKGIKRYYGESSKGEMDELLGDLTQSDITFGRSEEVLRPEEVDDSPVIKLVTLIITEALKARASDIHIEPMQKKLRIRYRIDGLCHEIESPPKRLQGAVLSRVKIMADMDIAEKRKPQDGGIRINLMGKDLDLRVSALPTTNGESIVLRILDKQEGLKNLDELGFHPDDYQKFRRIIKRPNGIFLITGPTGSGKTTTLYAALKELNRPDVKIITAENPVEYTLPGINQSQVKEIIGLTFARILRAMLRQAPNIILVGEIRDTETAEIAIQAALTGHLVFSTLHTNDAASAITRLIDMGVKPFLVASSIQAIMAQRLVRTLCGHCKEPYEPEESELRAVGIRAEDIMGKTIYRNVGCEACKFTGFKGRKAVFELLEMSSANRELAFRKAPLSKIREQAILDGMVTLMQDGVRKVLDGITTIEEILTIAKREDISY